MARWKYQKYPETLLPFQTKTPFRCWALKKRMSTLRLALDWTPNVNHSGFFAAQNFGWFQEAGIQLEIQHPGTDNYLHSPAKKIELGLADLALCPFESLLSYRTKSEPLPLLAVAAVLQTDLSSIVVKADSSIERPAQLDGKIYASYKARYEDAQVACMVRNDGGKGNMVLVYPNRLGIWNTLLNGEADATWIFDNWEGVQAQLAGIALRHFRMADHGIPYGYSPVLATTEAIVSTHKEGLAAILDASARGFAWAASHPQEMAGILLPLVPQADQNLAMLTAAQQATSPHYLHAQGWGIMETQRVQAYLNWLLTEGLERTKFEAAALFTNALLPSSR